MAAFLALARLIAAGELLTPDVLKALAGAVAAGAFGLVGTRVATRATRESTLATREERAYRREVERADRAEEDLEKAEDELEEMTARALWLIAEARWQRDVLAERLEALQRPPTP